MAWVDFYMQTTGNDLNAGSTNGDNAVYTSTGGNFDGTSVFTPTDGSTPASSINVGDYVSLYNTGDASARCVAKVTAVGAGINGTVTIDTTIKYGTVPTVNSGSRNLKAGGAWASLAIVAANAAFNTGTVPQSTRVNIKAGTYANTSTNRTFTLAGAATTPLWWRGYKTTIGDQDTNNLAVAGTDIPSWTFTTGAVTMSGTLQIMSNIDITGATTAGPLFNPNNASSNIHVYRIRVTNTAANANARAASLNGSGTVTGCYFKATTTADRCVSIAGGVRFNGNVVTGGIIGVANATTGVVITNCVFDSQAGDAIQVTSNIQAFIYNCSIYNPLGNGVSFVTTLSATGSIVANCYFENVNQAAKAAINNTIGTNTYLITVLGNAYFNCTSNISGITESFTIFDNGTLPGTVGAFIAPLSQNFAISSLGAAIGFPGKFENTSVYQGYLDVGAVQRQEVNPVNVHNPVVMAPYGVVGY